MFVLLWLHISLLFAQESAFILESQLSYFSGLFLAFDGISLTAGPDILSTKPVETPADLQDCF